MAGVASEVHRGLMPRGREPFITRVWSLISVLRRLSHLSFFKRHPPTAEGFPLVSPGHMRNNSRAFQAIGVESLQWFLQTFPFPLDYLQEALLGSDNYMALLGSHHSLWHTTVLCTSRQLLGRSGEERGSLHQQCGEVSNFSTLLRLFSFLAKK